MTQKKVSIVYWISTVLFALPLVWSAIMYLTEAPKMMATMSHLGYPVYFTKILGVAKLLGAAALLYPAMPRLKEWAYAGFTFDLIGAFVSHLSSGDTITIALVPLAFLALLMTSYWSRRALDADGSTRSALRRFGKPISHARQRGVAA
jgi:uncharacterized membrane protein YphA (DoxX/SURF4 family)